MNNMNHDLPSPSRIVRLDIVRLTAMLMVIGVLCIDPFTSPRPWEPYPNINSGLLYTAHYFVRRFPCLP